MMEYLSLFNEFKHAIMFEEWCQINAETSVQAVSYIFIFTRYCFEPQASFRKSVLAADKRGLSSLWDVSGRNPEVGVPKNLHEKRGAKVLGLSFNSVPTVSFIKSTSKNT